MNITQDVAKQYREKGLAIFSLTLLEEYNERCQKWKKKIKAQGAWNKIVKHSKLVFLKKHNAIGILTGSKSGVFVLDIDLLEHWVEWLKSHGRYNDWLTLEKTLVTVQTAATTIGWRSRRHSSPSRQRLAVSTIISYLRERWPTSKAPQSASAVIGR